MKAIISFVMLMLFAINTANAQPKSGLYLSVNPLAVLEPQSALGAGVGFRFNDYLEISTEYATLGSSKMFDAYRFNGVTGFRSVTQLKYTIGMNEDKYSKTFVGAEARYKTYTYTDVASFTNKQSGSVTKDCAYKNTTSVKGFAGIIGKQFDLGYLSNWSLEFSAGVGVRFTDIQRNGTPENSNIVPKDIGFGEIPNYVDHYTAFYFPIAVRVMVRL
ncbi:MAG: DUF3575 domain-containing protein [Chitinophagaceae bacterium]|jgi:hypothetical protein|nr:DUF3575 domain-containing protein [Chitinophagaceae bacterium]MBP9739213.1 DUF3575 domain-containing protein [Chitinophagaceae bacterium]